MPDRPHLELRWLVLLAALYLAGCNSAPSTLGGPVAGKVSSATADVRTPETRDAGAMEDLIASEKWTEPRCRWLKTGAWVLAWPQETALYRAAYDAGFIEMVEVGQGNRIGKPEPAWRITLTEKGKTETAECTTPGADNWGVPVSRRRLISGRYAGEDYGGRTVFEVDFEWVPTPIGEQVKHELTRYMTVEEGTYRTRVYLYNSRGRIDRGKNGWSVDAIVEMDGQGIRGSP